MAGEKVRKKGEKAREKIGRKKRWGVEVGVGTGVDGCACALIFSVSAVTTDTS